MKTVTLKARGDPAQGWHDAFVLQSALAAICEGKAVGKVALSMRIAGKVQEAMQDAGVNPGTNSADDVIVELRNAEAKLLWKEFGKIRPEQLGRSQLNGQPQSPNIGLMALMLMDLAHDLGETVEEPDEDEEE